MNLQGELSTGSTMKNFFIVQLLYIKKTHLVVKLAQIYSRPSVSFGSGL